MRIISSERSKHALQLFRSIDRDEISGEKICIRRTKVVRVVENNRI